MKHCKMRDRSHPESDLMCAPPPLQRRRVSEATQQHIYVMVSHNNNSNKSIVNDFISE